MAYIALSNAKETLDEGVALTSDFSQHGLQLRLPRLARVGDQMELTFNIKQELFPVIGEIVWVKPCDLGCDVGVRIVRVANEFESRVLEMLQGSES